MRRSFKKLPVYEINGWQVEKRPNSFAERFVYQARSTDADGYCNAMQGFQTLRDARAFCEATPIPQHRAGEAAAFVATI